MQSFLKVSYRQKNATWTVKKVQLSMLNFTKSALSEHGENIFWRHDGTTNNDISKKCGFRQTISSTHLTGLLNDKTVKTLWERLKTGRGPSHAKAFP